MATKKTAIPPAVNMRMQFTPIDEYVDRLMHDPQLGIRPGDETRRLLRYVLAQLSQSVMEVLMKGCENGMEQALMLMKDPNYYDKLKLRRQSRFQRSLEESKKNKADTLRKQTQPTNEDIQESRRELQRRVASHRDMVAWYRKHLAEAEAALAKFEQSPLNVLARVDEKSVKQ